MPLTGDSEIMAALAMNDIQSLSNLVFKVSKIQVRGADKFLNDLKHGKLSESSMDMFYRNILENISSFKSLGGVELGPTIAKSLEYSISRMREFFSEISVDEPLKYRVERIIPPDFREFERFATDATSANKRITKLLRLSDKSLCLPALKDEFITAFERVYKPVANNLNKYFNDGKIGKDRRNEIVEQLLCLQGFIGKGKKTKSDIREIRNLFAHPDRIDHLDFYRVRVGNWGMDLGYQDLLNINDCFITKCSIMMHLADVALDLELLGRMLKE